MVEGIRAHAEILTLAPPQSAAQPGPGPCSLAFCFLSLPMHSSWKHAGEAKPRFFSPLCCPYPSLPFQACSSLHCFLKHSLSWPLLQWSICMCHSLQSNRLLLARCLPPLSTLSPRDLPPDCHHNVHVHSPLLIREKMEDLRGQGTAQKPHSWKTFWSRTHTSDYLSSRKFW